MGRRAPRGHHRYQDGHSEQSEPAARDNLVTAVPGAEAAAFLRLEKDLEIDGETVEVEQLQVMLDMPGGQASVVRFIAEVGKWEEQMEAAYDSLVVAEETGS